MRRSGGPRCFGAAWVAGWAIAVFLPSLCIAYTQGPAEGPNVRRLVADCWHVADAMAPAAKLMLGALLAAGFAAADRAGRGRLRGVLGVLAGVAAMGLTLALIPADWSRGFGIGLTGARFPPALMPFYLGGAGIAGLVHVLGLARCRAKVGRDTV